MGPIYIGTSGYSYKSWGSTFYSADVPTRQHFEYYATQFPTVEVNATFYRLPAEAMVRGWRDRAPAGFTFAMKGSRFITHMKKLTDLGDATRKYFDRLKPLQRRVGVILWQLPPFLKKDLARLDAFLRSLPRSWRHAVEFRHPSWLTPESFRILKRHRAAHVSISSLVMPMDLTVTSDLVYIRFHGLEGGFAHDYTRHELEPWSDHIRRQASLGKAVFAYFNNDANCRAPGNAKTLIRMAT